jgi:predicted ATPase
MKRYILTGTPGAGKTSVLRLLESLGYAVVEEAATAVIALEQALGRPDPWAGGSSFVDKIVTLQRQRELRASTRDGAVVLFDRSPICTYALCTYVGLPISPALAAEVDRVTRNGVYQSEVFFLRNLGFVERTAARRITFADSLRFERIHEATYRAFGYHLVDVPAAPLADRVAAIRAALTPEPTPGQPCATTQNRLPSVSASTTKSAPSG